MVDGGAGAEETATLALQGERVTLDQFAASVTHFTGLLHALSREADVPKLEWEVEALEVGSTTTTARAVPNGYSPEAVERVTASFLEVGQALQFRHPIPYGPEVQEEAAALADVLRSGVEAVRFETAVADAIVTEPLLADPPAPPPTFRPARGSVRGRVQTLTNRRTLRFTLYDLITDRAVACYVRPEDEEKMRGIWGEIADVEGLVSRDPLTGRPVAVRQVTAIRLVPTGESHGYRRARGASPRRAGQSRAEDRIRRLRDG